MSVPKASHTAQADMLANRVKKRFAHLSKRFARQNIEVFRLYDWDIPEIRAVVDWYAGHLVIGEYARAQSTPEWLPLMASAVARALTVPDDNVHLKVRYYGKAKGKRYERIDFTDKMIVVAERDFKFQVNPWDYVDTGLFSDHRDTRQMVRQAAAGKDFLNLFCYSGTFTCYAAKGGARTTVSVDRSQTAIAWTRQNLALNGLPETGHQLVQAHALNYLARARRENRQFDLAVVDPPSFSTTRSSEDHFDIAEDHPTLLNAVIDVLRKNATIFFSTNHQNFSLRPDELHAGSLEEITAHTIPEDYQHKRKLIHRCWKIRV
jgi:23S rRNA (cytosine1962-C5)-methyltransferase